MKLWSRLFLSISAISGVLAAKPAQDTFQKYQSLSRSGPVELNNAAYEELTNAPRDYYTAVILTAMDARYGCAMCREFDPEWTLIAKSWNKGNKPDDLKLVFGTLDFDQGKAVFQKLMLQTAPVILLFPPTIGPFAKLEAEPARFDFTGPISADQLYAWINRHLPDGPKPQLIRPVNYMRIVSAITILLGAITLFTVLSPYLLPFIQNRNLWAAFSLIAILLFTSGQMFNHIRKVPYVAGDGNGGISYFAGGFQNQFGLETQIVAAIYAILSFATIALALKVPRMEDAKGQQLAVLIWTGVLFGTYSFLLSVFKTKNGGYPFYLPPF
ncbi:Magnesium transporter protein 1 [Penicillium rolfsii]|nr:Magnesium transporter protein 1 [Penicillium rolfsii]